MKIKKNANQYRIISIEAKDIYFENKIENRSVSILNGSNEYKYKMFKGIFD